jgi:hypothetical protein
MIRTLWRMLKDLVTLKTFWGGSSSTVPANAEHMAEKTMQANIPPVSSPQQPILQNVTDNIASTVEQEVGAEAQAGLQKTSGWFSWRKILGGTVALAGLAVFHKEAGLAAGKALDMTPESLKKLADRAGKAIGGYVPDGFKASAGEAFGKASEIWTSNAEALRNTTFSTVGQAYEKLPPLPDSVKTPVYNAYESACETATPYLGQAWETVKTMTSAGLEKVANAWPKSLPQG